MKKILLVSIFVGLMVLGAWTIISCAEPYYHPFAYESVTIAATAGGTTLTAATYLGAIKAYCTLEIAQIRFTFDNSTAPTAAIGHLWEVGQEKILEDKEILSFKGFRTTSTSGVLKCTYMK
jgi:hypothetical protein